MMHRSILRVLMAMAVTACSSAIAQEQAQDIFGQLQGRAWYLPTRDHAANLYVTELGARAGVPVVVLHGGPGNDFQYLVPALHGQLQRRFVLFDQRGSLLSPVPEHDVAKLSLAQLVDDLEALRVALGQPRLVLFGHSFGSALALAYYQAHPDRVAGMVLTGTFPPYMPPGGIKAFVQAMRPRQKALSARADIEREVARAGLPKDAAADSPQQASDRWRITRYAPINIIDLSRWRQAIGGKVYYNIKVDGAIGATLPATLDVRPALRSHPVPISVIQGDRDYIDPAAQSWRPLAAAGKVRIAVMPAASHAAWIDQPQAFASALKDALGRMDGR